MAYCRFSSMNDQCDLYIYDDVDGGLTIHVASQRRQLPEDYPNHPLEDFAHQRITTTEFGAILKKRAEILEAAPSLPIGLSRDGQSYSNIGYEEGLALVKSLREEGYVFPDFVEDAIRENIEDFG